MSRIEIPMKEFNGLKDRIKTLENALGDVSREASAYKEKLSKIEGLVMDLESESWVDRLFTWKSIVKPFKDLFSNGNSL